MAQSILENPFKGRDVISARDFSRKDLEVLFSTADKIVQTKEGVQVPSELRRDGKVVSLLFYEPSTRTYESFARAGHLIGCYVNGFREPKVSSASKGESLADTVRTFEQLDTSCFVIRSPHPGAPLSASKLTDMPVINAGDGPREHPTQAMGDLYTILKRKGTIDGLQIGVMGDLRYGRTPPSLSYMLANYDVKRLVFIAPSSHLQIGENVELELKRRGIAYEKSNDPKGSVGDLDILYVTRVQKERFTEPTDYEKIKGSYVVDKSLVESGKNNLLIMHPLPRIDELTPDVDDLKNAAYFPQVGYGKLVRTALLSLTLGDK